MEKIVRFGPLVTLVWVTTLEYARQKWLMASWLVGLLWLLLSSLFSSLSIDEHFRIMLHLGFFSAQLTGVIIGLVIGSSWLHRELEFQSIYVILSRPISRIQYVLSKLFAFIAILLVTLISLGLIHWILLKDKEFDLIRFIYVYFTMAAEALVVYQVAQVASLWLKPVLSFAVGLMAWLAGWWMGDLIFFAKKSQMFFFKVASWVLPYFFVSFDQWSHLRSIYFIKSMSDGGWAFIVMVMAIVYSLLLSFVSMWFFEKRDLVS